MTNLNTLIDYLLSKQAAVEERPFGPQTMVFKVMGKMFALVGFQGSVIERGTSVDKHEVGSASMTTAAHPNNEPLRINLKCDPFLAQLLREKYEAVIPGYHMNKRHWNTVILDGSIPDDEVQEMIDESYALVVKGLKKADREKLGLDI